MKDFINGLSLKVKLLSLILIISLITVSIITSISYVKSKDSLVAQAINQLSAQGESWTFLSRSV